MDDVEEIRKRKILELQEHIYREQKKEEQYQQIEQIAKSKLTKDALNRFGNINAAYPELAQQVVLLLAQAEKKVINDDELKRLLMIINKETKREIKIIRK